MGTPQGGAMISASARALIGALVTDAHNGRVWKIEDLIIDLRSGCIALAVLSPEHSLPLEDRPGCLVLPWSALVPNGIPNAFTLKVDFDVFGEASLRPYPTSS